MVPPWESAQLRRPPSISEASSFGACPPLTLFLAKGGRAARVLASLNVRSGVQRGGKSSADSGLVGPDGGLVVLAGAAGALAGVGGRWFQAGGSGRLRRPSRRDPATSATFGVFVF